MSYGLFLYADLADGERIEILKKDYAGASHRIKAMGSPAYEFHARDNDSAEITNVPIVKSSLNLNIKNMGDFDYEMFFTVDATMWRVVLKRNSKQIWSGYVTPESYATELSYRNTITIIARDNLGVLEQEKYNWFNEEYRSLKDLIQKACDMISWNFEPISFVPNVRSESGWYLEDAFIPTIGFKDKTWWDLLSEILISFGYQMSFYGNNTWIVTGVSDAAKSGSVVDITNAKLINSVMSVDIVPSWKELDIVQDYQKIKDMEVEKPTWDNYVFWKEISTGSGRGEETLRLYNIQNTDIVSTGSFPVIKLDRPLRPLPSMPLFVTPTHEKAMTGGYISKSWDTQKSDYETKIEISIINNAFNKYGSKRDIPVRGSRTIRLWFSVILKSKTSTFYLTSNGFIPYTGIEDAGIMFDVPIGEWANVPIYIVANSIPEDGQFELRIMQPRIYDHDLKQYIESLSNNVFFSSVKLSPSEGAPKERHSVITINPQARNSESIEFNYGELPANTSTLMYIGGLYGANYTQLSNFKRIDGLGGIMPLSEIVGRGYAHRFNGFNTSQGESTGGKILKCNLEWDSANMLVSNILKIDSELYYINSASFTQGTHTASLTLVQVKPYTHKSYGITVAPIDTGGGVSLGSGRIDQIAWSSQAGNSKRLYELQMASVSDANNLYVAVDKLGNENAQKFPLSDLVQKSHALTHSAGGNDPLTPDMIGAAEEKHSHEMAEIDTLSEVISQIATDIEGKHPLGGDKDVDFTANDVVAQNINVIGTFTAAELITRKVRAQGGELLVTPANLKCNRTEDYPTHTRCFFDTLDGTVSNEFVLGDGAKLQVFGAKSRYLWAKVIDVGVDYIDISKTVKTPNSNTSPNEGDDIVQFGHESDKARQGAIKIAAIGSSTSPEVTVIGDIDITTWSYKEVGRLGRKGGADEDKDKFGIWVKSGAAENFVIGSGCTGLQNFTEWSGVESGISNAQDAADQAQGTADKGVSAAADALAKALKAEADAANSVADYNAKFALQQAQIDGEVSNWYYSYKPTLTNAPASSWANNAERDRHIGDTFLNTQPYVDDKTTPDAGKAWRYVKNGTVYSWTPISDSDAVKALQDAAKAQSTADGKSTTFVLSGTDTPKTYDYGDMWVLQSDTVHAPHKTGEVMFANTKRAGQYVAADWVTKVRYTDDTAVNNLQIGGVNLFLYTQDPFKNISAWNNNLGASKWGEVGGFTAFKIQAQWGRLWQFVDYQEGQTYTCSCWVRRDPEIETGITLMNVFGSGNNIEILSVRLDGVEMPFTPSLSIDIPLSPTTFQKLIFTFNVKVNLPNSNYIRVEFFTKDYNTTKPCGVVYGYKLEQGNKATSWTPAVADVQFEIDSAQTTASAAMGRVDVMAQDNVISIEEKARLRNENIELGKEYDKLKELAASVGITIEVKTATSGKSKLWSAYNGIQTAFGSAWVNISNNTDYTFITTVGRTKSDYLDKFAAWKDAVSDLGKQISQKQVDSVQVGGRNLALNSKIDLTTNSYMIHTVSLSEELQDGQEIAITVNGEVPEGKVYYVACAPSSFLLLLLTKTGYRQYSGTVRFAINPKYPNDVRDKLMFFNFPQDGNNPAVTNTIMVTKGNKQVDWQPAPEDVQTEIDKVQAAADTAIADLATINSDSIVSPPEKPALKAQWDMLLAEKASIDKSAELYLLTASTEYQNYVAWSGKAIAAYRKYSNTEVKDIAITADYADISTYQTHKKAILEKLEVTIKEVNDGKYTEYRYRVNGSTIVSPSVSDIQSWTTSVPSIQAFQYCWSISALKRSDGTLIGAWSAPALTSFKGVGGYTELTVNPEPYSANTTYTGDVWSVEAVEYNSKWYITRSDVNTTFKGIPPTDTAYWNPVTVSADSIATNLLIANETYIKNLGVENLKTAKTGTRVEVTKASNDIKLFVGSQATPALQIASGVDRGFVGMKLSGDDYNYASFVDSGLKINTNKGVGNVDSVTGKDWASALSANLETIDSLDYNALTTHHRYRAGVTAMVKNTNINPTIIQNGVATRSACPTPGYLSIGSGIIVDMQTDIFGSTPSATNQKIIANGRRSNNVLHGIVAIGCCNMLQGDTNIGPLWISSEYPTLSLSKASGMNGEAYIYLNGLNSFSSIRKNYYMVIANLNDNSTVNERSINVDCKNGNQFRILLNKRANAEVAFIIIDWNNYIFIKK